MNERKPATGKLPSPRGQRGKSNALAYEAERPIQLTAKGRRGRLSHEEYVKAVCTVIRWDPFQLENCALLGQLPGVHALAQRLKKAIFPTGTAIHHLIERSVDEVERLAKMQHDVRSLRVALFLQIWYRQRGTVVDTADALDLSRSYVAHRIQPLALEMVALRFLDLAWQVETSA